MSLERTVRTLRRLLDSGDVIPRDDGSAQKSLQLMTSRHHGRAELSAKSTQKADAHPGFSAA